MVDTETNPYQPPKSSLERNFKVLGAKGYRDGGHLIAREGFESPRICVVSGEPVEDGVEPEKVMMRSNIAWKVGLGLVFGSFVGIGVYQLSLLENFSSLLISIAMFGFFIVFIFWLKPNVGFIHVYCSKKIAKKRKRFKTFTSIFSLGGVACMLFYDSLFSDSEWMFLILGLIILSNFLNPKKLLKSIGREGDYERFQGAHSNFLDALPSGSELETKI